MNRSEGQWVQPELTHTIHRGIGPSLANKVVGGTGAPHDPGVGKDGRVGIHWTSSPSVAKTFAGGNGFWGTGYILHGEAPISSSETNRKTLEENQVDLTGKLHEKEVTLKKNAPVKVTGKSVIKEVPGTNATRYRVRTRRYHPPREMKA